MLCLALFSMKSDPFLLVVLKNNMTFFVKKMSYYLQIARKALLLSPSSSPGGGIGRRAGLKIQCPLKTCGFDSRPGYKNSLLIS